MRLGDFHVEGQLGRGGMATVQRAVHGPTQVEVALKLAFEGSTVVEEFAREVHAVAQMLHPSVVTVYDYGHTEAELHLETQTIPIGAPWLAMELAAGGPLRHSDVGNWPQLRTVLQTLLDALAHAHARGIIHRDIKPANILIRSREEVLDVALSDFGIAHLVASDQNARNASSSAGTPRYMAPEQHTGDAFKFGPPTDLYALGCVAWELVTGEVPFSAKTALALSVLHVASPLPAFHPRFEVPPGFEEWLHQMLAKEPADRFAFARGAADALSGLAGEDVPAPATAPTLSKVAALGPGLFGIRELPLVGRKTECTRLREHLTAVVSSRDPRVLVLEGPAGAGKSRLGRWLTYEAHAAGVARYLQVDCRRDVEEELCRELSSLFGLVGMNRAQALERLAQLGTEATHHVALFRRALTDGDEVEELSGRARTQAIWQALRLAAADIPLVIWLDDALWSTTSVELCERIAAGNSPFLVIATARTDDVADRPDESEALRSVAQRYELSALPAERCRDLVRSILPLDAAAVDRIAHRADGNPLFAVQLVGDWIQRGMLQWSAGGLAASRLDESSVPLDVRDLWLRRVDDVLWEAPEDDRRAIHLAATLGHVVEKRPWLRACEVLGLQPSTSLAERLVRRRLATWIEGGFAFIHGLLVDSLLSSIPEKSGRELHAACAETLERSRDWPSLGRAGKHWLEAGQPERALGPLTQAAEGASIGQHYRPAQEFAALAQTATRNASDEERARLDLIQLSAHRSSIPLDEYVERATLVAERARDADWPEVLARALDQRAPMHNGLGDHAAAIEDLFEAADLFGELGNAHRRTSVLTNLAYILEFAGETDDAIQVGEAALTAAETLGRKPAIATACERLAYVYRNVDPARCRGLQERGLALAKDQGLMELQGHLLDALGTTAYDDGELQLAADRYLAAERCFDAAGVPIVWMSRFNRGYVLLMQRNVDEALALIEPATEVFEKLGVFNFVTYSRACMFAASALRQDQAGASKWLGELEAALATWEVGGKMVGKAISLALDGLPEDAQDLRSRALRLTEQ